MSKIHANRGVERNKKPLQNILYKIENRTVNDELKHILYWAYVKDFHRHEIWFLHDYVESEGIRARLSAKQWCKFCRGDRNFVIQRRVNGRNVPI